MRYDGERRSASIMIINEGNSVQFCVECLQTNLRVIFPDRLLCVTKAELKEVKTNSGAASLVITRLRSHIQDYETNPARTSLMTVCGYTQQPWELKKGMRIVARTNETFNCADPIRGRLYQVNFEKDILTVRDLRPFKRPGKVEQWGMRVGLRFWIPVDWDVFSIIDPVGEN